MILLYIEVVSAIKIYFFHKYHFPLRFFFYIGITHLLRHIVISEGEGKVLFSALAILVLVTGLAALEFKNFYLAKQKKEAGMDNDLEL